MRRAREEDGHMRATVAGWPSIASRGFRFAFVRIRAGWSRRREGRSGVGRAFALDDGRLRGRDRGADGERARRRRADGGARGGRAEPEAAGEPEEGDDGRTTDAGVRRRVRFAATARGTDARARRGGRGSDAGAREGPTTRLSADMAMAIVFACGVCARV